MMAMLRRELALLRAGGSSPFVGVLFLGTVVTAVAFGVGSDLDVLARIAPAVLWTGTLLASLLGLERLFRPDLEDGTLDLLAASQAPMGAIALAKAAGHWLGNVLPLVLATMPLGLLLGLTPWNSATTAFVLLVGTPAFSLIGTMGAALGLSARRGAMLTAVVAVPFALPALIFGVGASVAWGTADFATPFLLMCASALFALVLAPVGAGAALNALRDGG